ncbi:MAG TPA: C4-type zinc ribbon domain-containing protein [Anaerolineales bacterium]|nr:C4-type zinc ribbon domain-containing protein [Anaerolineales bacterium]
MSSAFKLLRLQQVDSQLDHVKSRLAEIERMLANDEVVKQAQITLQEAEQSRETAQKELSRADEEVKAIQAKLKENQEHLYGGKVRNPKELQDLQMEAESLNRHLRALEDSELEKMMALEERQTEAKVADGALEAVRAQRAAENRTLGSEQNKLLAEAERLQEERSTNLNSIDERDLKIYDGLRASKGGIAVAKVQNKTCGACGAELSASLAQAARSPNELTRCDNCKRILYAG